ncbi:type II toxin-antitoxin system PemK/MazF family toxin [Lentilactobacillus otakiensis]|uniref:type II toxin-antitoxin system PemK/MazF family toxin n=1 Tax=Lentilactobacillus otakiensis TaxID=481720 RepID=UPI00293CABDC|nr:type II toxin-antitoxin system PemK/MazF family toxin [Lentilactobacillus otakiensis]MDV3519261.1 type II toxin-antitoxin system PemK/MazF family toxin [Lentilactobacillus otakiensis]
MNSRKRSSNKIYSNLQFLISKSHNKFKGIDVTRELMTYSQALVEDFNHRKTNSRYQIYKRGTVAYVDFGLGVGSELSGPHYAIVLNKKDNPNNSKITVIPLTSKKGKENIPLPEGVNKIFAIWYALSGLAHNKTFPSEDQILTQFFRIIDKSDQEASSKAKQDLLNYFHHFTEENRRIKEKLNMQMSSLEKISYFKINNLATVSKFRIRLSKHKYDPIGKIRIPNSDMDIIDEIIARYFLDK